MFTGLRSILIGRETDNDVAKQFDVNNKSNIQYHGPFSFNFR